MKAIVEESGGCHRLGRLALSGFGDRRWICCYTNDVVAMEHGLGRRSEPGGMPGFQNDCTGMKAAEMKEEGARAQRIKGLLWRELEEEGPQPGAEMACLFKEAGELGKGCRR